MPKYAMVIDLQSCVGCGACSIACKNENNLPEGIFWSSKITETVGTFPDVRYHYIPTLCNHCEDAPCVRVAPPQPCTSSTMVLSCITPRNASAVGTACLTAPMG